MYSDVFCKIYNELGWNYYPEAFGGQLLEWIGQKGLTVRTAMDLGCGTGVLCRILADAGMEAAGMDLSEGMIAIAKESSPDISYAVADMTTFRPEKQFDLVTCTGDAINHIPALSDVEKIFSNVYGYLSPGGYFVFDILNEHEASAGEPFEMDFTDRIHVWFQMTKPTEKSVNLKVKVYEDGKLQFEENIRETIHDPGAICDLLTKCGFTVLQCTDWLLENADNHATTWYVIATK